MPKNLTFIALVSAFILTLSSSAFAIGAFDGVEHATIEVDGKEYYFPIGLDEGGRDRSGQVYFLKKALNGDKEALDMFLGGEREKMFYIGRETPLWLRVSHEKIEVIKP